MERMELEQFETTTIGSREPTSIVWIPLSAPTRGPVEEEWPTEVEPGWDQDCDSGRTHRMTDRAFIGWLAPLATLFLVACNLGAFVDPAWFWLAVPAGLTIPWLFWKWMSG